jgi:hypothetical protein
MKQDWYVSNWTVPPWVLYTSEIWITLTKPEQYQVQLYDEVTRGSTASGITAGYDAAS